jgi:hypothetical protein
MIAQPSWGSWQHRRDPQQQRKEMEELGGELAWEAGPAGLGEPVRPGLGQPRGRLLVRQAIGVHAQLSQHDLGWKRGQPRQRHLTADRGRDQRSGCLPSAVSVAAGGGRGRGGLHDTTWPEGRTAGRAEGPVENGQPDPARPLARLPP